MLENSTTQEFDAFVAYGRDRLAGDASVHSLEDLLHEWRADNPSPKLSADDIAAVQEAIEDYKNGDRGRPAEEVSAELVLQLERMEN